ncbi:MAG TPA: class I SAM-dependent methyltransferase [Rariglobus sp.]|jgi:ubiquinone/menaquinone biosynthesis C-methylase UbiE|nr:class I SAM-dependent methyltransferase [Rariglobus sp.]
MNHVTAGEYWNGNAEAWSKLARAGHDIFRDHLNTPAFFELLPPVSGLSGLDIGCGEGHNTRMLARRGAKMTAIDIAATFIRHARAEEARASLGITYQEASAVELPFAEGAFAFATAFMSLHDIPETKRVLAEAFRVIAPGGFLQFSILHPCFNPPHRRTCRDEDHIAYAVELGDYFVDARGRIDEWTFGTAPQTGRDRLPKFKVPRFHRPVSEWLNLLVEAGFLLERFAEPCPSAETVVAHPSLQDARIVPYFLHIRVRKPAAGA